MIFFSSDVCCDGPLQLTKPVSLCHHSHGIDIILHHILRFKRRLYAVIPRLLMVHDLVYSRNVPTSRRQLDDLLSSLLPNVRRTTSTILEEQIVSLSCPRLKFPPCESLEMFNSIGDLQARASQYDIIRGSCKHANVKALSTSRIVYWQTQEEITGLYSIHPWTELQLLQ